MKPDTQERLAASRDRITQLLEKQAQPTLNQDIGDISQALLAALSKGTGALGFQESYQGMQQNRTQAATNLYNMMQQEVGQGNQDAAAVDKAIKDITGDDIKGYEAIANVIHQMPEQVGQHNASMAAIKAANSVGYKPKLGLKEQAEINLKNAQANYYNQKGEDRQANSMPATALKLQNEALDIIGTAGGINADLQAISNQLESGDLDLGVYRNAKSWVQNQIGKSTKISRNFDSFNRTLEKLRNDSLRLNKGVQTEGDSQRAWNELIKNINDPKLVKERIAEIIAINERGADLQKLNVDQIRNNYGVGAADYSQYTQRPAAIGGRSKASTAEDNYKGYSYKIK